MRRKTLAFLLLFVLAALILAACAAQPGPAGPTGPAGPPGPQGEAGPAGTGLTDEQATAVANAAALPWPAEEEIRRGCPACHVLIDAETGRYTLAFEAHERAEARGEEHPDVAPDGTSLAVTEEVNVRTCLLCHAPGTGEREGMGVVAPLSLRDIVHPAHMSSPYFTLHYRGSCFTCHNVDGEGTFELLTEKVEVNDKGVPDDEALPIPGAIEPSERGG